MTVGIVGYGKFGALTHQLVKRFVPDAQVRIFSSRAQPDGTLFFSLEEVAKSDAVILSVPIHTFEENLQKILPFIGEHTVLVDVATVKMHTVEILKRLAPASRWVATHPMWGPESYAKRGGDVAGFRIVITESTIPQEQRAAAVSFLKECGFDVVEMSPEQHDQHLAETLFLTHFIGQSVARAGFGRTPIDTVSFGFLMDAMESVRHDTELFQDVFRFNPYCKEVLKKFEVAEEAVQALLSEKR